MFSQWAPSSLSHALNNFVPLYPSKEHCLGDIILTKHVCFFQRALLGDTAFPKEYVQQHCLQNKRVSMCVMGHLLSPLTNCTFLSASVPHVHAYPELKGWRRTTYQGSLSKAFCSIYYSSKYKTRSLLPILPGAFCDGSDLLNALWSS